MRIGVIPVLSRLGGGVYQYSLTMLRTLDKWRSNGCEDEKSQKVVQTGQKGKVAFFFWEGYLGVAPSLINGIRMLATAGYGVDVITRYNCGGHAPAPNFPKSVRVIPCAPLSLQVCELSSRIISAQAKAKKNDFVNWLSGFVPQSLKELLQKLLSDVELLVNLLRFLAFGVQRTKSHHYTCFIGVDELGLITATASGFVKRVPILYWSLEIVFLNEFRDPIMRLLKRLERLCNRRAVLTIIQDMERANSLMSENEVSLSKIAIVPNSPLGLAPNLKSNFFQQRFRLPLNHRVILHIGVIGPTVLSLELAAQASKWPDDWVLVLHERAKRDYSDPFIKRIQEVGKGKVFLSLEPVLYDDLDTVVASGQIGIVLYRMELGPNYAQMAGASGKLGHYLRCGLPVVCLDFPGLAEIIHKYQCGICVKDIGQITQAIQRIFEDYSFYSTNAVKCYEEVYEFSVHFQQVLEQMQQLNQRKGGNFL